MVFAYTSYLHLAAVARPRPVRALFIGLGGGSAPAKFLHDYASLTRVDVAELDPDVVKVARRYFNVPDDTRLHLVQQDGRLFVEEKAREIAGGRSLPYDLVVIDAYSASTIPYHLATLEFFRSVRAVLAPDGVVASNIIGAMAGPTSRLLRAMTRTLGEVFPQVYLFPVGTVYSLADPFERNVVAIATMKAGILGRGSLAKKSRGDVCRGIDRGERAGTRAIADRGGRAARGVVARGRPPADRRLRARGHPAEPAALTGRRGDKETGGQGDGR